MKIAFEKRGGQSFPPADAAAAHRHIEPRESTAELILLP